MFYLGIYGYIYIFLFLTKYIFPHTHLLSICVSVVSLNSEPFFGFSSVRIHGPGLEASLERPLPPASLTRVLILCLFGFFFRWPHFLPVLEPEYVAKKIVNAILTDQTYLLMPRGIYLLMFLKR